MLHFWRSHWQVVHGSWRNSQKFHFDKNQCSVVRFGSHKSATMVWGVICAVSFYYHLKQTHLRVHTRTNQQDGGVSRSSCSRSVLRWNHTRSKSSFPTKKREHKRLINQRRNRCFYRCYSREQPPRRQLGV